MGNATQVISCDDSILKRLFNVSGVNQLIIQDILMYMPNLSVNLIDAKGRHFILEDDPRSLDEICEITARKVFHIISEARSNIEYRREVENNCSVQGGFKKLVNDFNLSQSNEVTIASRDVSVREISGLNNSNNQSR